MLLLEAFGWVIPLRARRTALGVHGWSWAMIVRGGTSGWSSGFWLLLINIQAAHPKEDLLFLIEVCLPVFAWEGREGAITESWPA